MVFGFGRRVATPTALPDAATPAAASPPPTAPPASELCGLAALAAGADDVSWEPLPVQSGSGSARTPRQPQPFKMATHDIKAHLQDRSTAVVQLSSVVHAPADVLFELLADPHQHEHIFDAIESAQAELVSEEGPVRRWRLDYRARWKFWRVGGVCDNRLWMTTDRDAGTVSFQLREPGFLRRYEGTWSITGPDGRGPGGQYTAPATPHNSSTASLLPPSPPPASAPTTDTSPPSSSVASMSYSAAIPRSPSASSSASSRASGLSRLSAASSASGVECTDDSASSLSCATSSPQQAVDGTGGCGVGGIFAAMSLYNPFAAAAMKTTPPSVRPSSPPPPPPLAPPPPASAASSRTRASRSPSTVLVRKSISPRVSPPFPVNQVLKGHACGQVNEMLEGLLLATARRLEEEEEGVSGEGAGAGSGSRK